MSYTSDTPFDNIESSHQYVSLLHDAIEEARREVDEEIAFSTDKDERKEAGSGKRQTFALLLVLALLYGSTKRCQQQHWRSSVETCASLHLGYRRPERPATECESTQNR